MNLSQPVNILQQYFADVFKKNNLLLRNLDQNGINTLEQLTDYCSLDLLKLPGLDKLQVNQLKNALKAVGLTLSEKSREEKYSSGKYNDAFLDTTVKSSIFIEDTTLNKTIIYALSLAGVIWVGDLTELTEAEIQHYRLISNKRMLTIKAFLNAHGSSFKIKDLSATVNVTNFK